MRSNRLLLLFLLSCVPVHALTCVAVAASSAGAATGADWSDAKAYSSLAGSSFVRGDRYYFADGNYGTSLSITTAASGSLIIELRKAQSYDFGRTSDGCTNDISAGWNTSTMGSSQAAWFSQACNPTSCSNSIVNLGSGGFITINGNPSTVDLVGCGGVAANPPATMTGPAPNPSNCGFLISDFTCTSTVTNGCDTSGGEIRGGAANILWEYVEWFGQGLNSNGNNNSETYFWFANGGVLTNMQLTHMYIHNIGTVAVVAVTGGWNNGSFDHNYHWGEFDGSVNHGESVQLQGGNTGLTIHHNIWRDQQTNGDVVSTDSGGNTLSFSVYDNADFCSAGGTGTSCRHNDGFIGCFGTGVCTVLAYNNTISYPGLCGYNIGGGSGGIPGTMTMENNIFYNCSSFVTTIGTGGSATIDYNTYLCSGKSAVGAHDVSVSSSCPDPFVNIHLGAQLASEGADWNNRVILGSPYDTLDLYGNVFTTDRGAAQFVSSSIDTFTLGNVFFTGKVFTQ